MQVEESGLITFNKFFESKAGKLAPQGVEAYVDSGEACVLRPACKAAHRSWWVAQGCSQAIIPCCRTGSSFSAAGPLRDRPVVIVAEDFIKKWAVARYRWAGLVTGSAPLLSPLLMARQFACVLSIAGAHPGCEAPTPAASTPIAGPVVHLTPC